MAALEYDGPMVDPLDVARASLDGVQRDAAEVVVDEWRAPS